MEKPGRCTHMLSELGEVLQKAREAKGLSLEDIQETTKIQRRYLDAIEKGDFEALPGQFYARAFIKRYAEALGLNAEEILSQYSKEVPTVQHAAEEEEIPTILQKNQVNQESIVASGKWISRAIVAVLAVVILSLIWLAVSTYQSKKDTPALPTQQAPGVNKNNPDNVVVPPPKPTEQKPAENTQTNGTLTPVSQDVGNTIWTYDLTGASKITIQITSKTSDKWLQIKTPTKVIEEVTLKQGESKSWDITDSNEVSFYMHDATTVEIKINGQTIDTSKCSKNQSQHFKVTRKNP